MAFKFSTRLILIFSLVLLVCCKGRLPAQDEKYLGITVEDILKRSSYWVDSVYNSLSERERIAQLFWLAVENPGNQTAYSRLVQLVETYQPGGIILFRMEPEVAVGVIADLQSRSRVPMLVSIDGEWGLAMRFPGVKRFPYAMTLGAIQDDNLVYRMGLEMARQFRLMGIHVNMAPVADVNSNPLNPVIGHRSFGEQPCNVARKAVAYMQGLQAGNVMAVGKHFPGHGDTSTDSHYTLPLLQHDYQRLTEVDFPPFQALIDSSVWGIMTAHIEVPVLEPQAGVPASFSHAVINEELRARMGFNGLIITDAVNMKGAKVMGNPGVVDALALAAGNDIVLFTENISAGIDEVIKLIDSGVLTWQQIEEKCRRSLAFKYWLAINNPAKPTEIKNLTARLNSKATSNIIQELHEASITILRNDGEVLAFKNKVPTGYASLVIGNAPFLVNKIEERFDIPAYNLTNLEVAAFDRIIKSLERYEGLVVVIADSRWGRLAANAARRDKITKLTGRMSTVTIFMGNAYHLASWRGLANSSGLILTYQHNEFVEKAVWRFLNGEIGADGKLPVTIDNLFKAGGGLEVN